MAPSQFDKHTCTMALNTLSKIFEDSLRDSLCVSAIILAMLSLLTLSSLTFSTKRAGVELNERTMLVLQLYAFLAAVKRNASPRYMVMVALLLLVPMFPHRTKMMQRIARQPALGAQNLGTFSKSRLKSIIVREW